MFVVKEEALANLTCVPKDGLLGCMLSRVNVDPVITFDQARFDVLADQLGEQRVPLDQYTTLEFSPGLDQLPPIPSGANDLVSAVSKGDLWLPRRIRTVRASRTRSQPAERDGLRKDRGWTQGAGPQ